jgi:CheY-like chemotaxis protein
MQILVVEDDEAVRQSLKGWLLGKGHTATWCKTGRQALEAMHRERFDLVVLDMVLEGVMTGWDVAYIKHVDDKLTGIPLIILTGVSSKDVVIGAHTQVSAVRAAVAIIPKPIDFRELEKALIVVQTVEPVTKVHGRGVLPDKDRGDSHG